MRTGQNLNDCSGFRNKNVLNKEYLTHRLNIEFTSKILDANRSLFCFTRFSNLSDVAVTIRSPFVSL